MKRRIALIFLMFTLGGSAHCGYGGYTAGELLLEEQSAVALAAVFLSCRFAVDVNRTQAQRDHDTRVCETGVLYFAADLDKDREDY